MYQCEEQGCTFIIKQWSGPQREQRGCELDGKRYDDIPSIENYLDQTMRFTD